MGRVQVAVTLVSQWIKVGSRVKRGQNPNNNEKEEWYYYHEYLKKKSIRNFLCAKRKWVDNTMDINTVRHKSTNHTSVLAP